MRMTLRAWQSAPRPDPQTWIVQASAVDGSDAWQDHMIGYCFHAIWNVPAVHGEHAQTALCAFANWTDERRRGAQAVTRKSIERVLQSNGITNAFMQAWQMYICLPTYKYVISPEGNGVDCYRHYEALMAGCIPVMEDNPLTRKKYAGLPILYTKDYSEVTPAYLLAQYESMLDAEYDFSSLFMDAYSSETQSEIIAKGNYWCQKHTNKVWYAEWQFALRGLQNAPLVWISMINSGYVAFARHFINNLKALGLEDFPLVIVCIDDESYAAMQHQRRVRFGHGFDKQLTAYGTPDFKRIMFNKLDSISAAMAQFVKCNIGVLGYIDLDVAVLKNPTPIVLDMFHANPEAAVVSQCGECARTCSCAQACPLFCAGVMAFRTSLAERIQPALHYLPEHVLTTEGDDQGFLNLTLPRHGIRNVTVNTELFPNGAAANVSGAPDADIISKAALIHFNYLYAADKIPAMRRWGLWYE